tara:strand:+ start:3531 stop:3803 length:273 start_codon:yes stop_codon:yes gene_type:complete
MTKEETDLIKQVLKNQEEFRETYAEMKTEVMGVKTVLVGYNGDEGLVGRVETLSTSYYKFKDRATLVFGVLLGTGVIGGSAYGLVRLIAD